jgi:hypothetical protein
MVQGKTELTLAPNSVILVELATQFADAPTAIRAVGLWCGLLETSGSLMAGSCKTGIDICSKEAMCKHTRTVCMDQASVFHPVANMATGDQVIKVTQRNYQVVCDSLLIIQ